MRNAKRGFSLSELLIAAAILALAVSFILLEIIAYNTLNSSSRHLTTAVSHARYVMEDIRNAGFITVRESGNTLWDWDSSRITSEGLNCLNGENIDTSVSGTDPLDVMVTVNWNDTNQRTKSIYLETLIAQ